MLQTVSCGMYNRLKIFTGTDLDYIFLLGRLGDAEAYAPNLAHDHSWMLLPTQQNTSSGYIEMTPPSVTRADKQMWRRLAIYSPYYLGLMIDRVYLVGYSE